MDKSLVERLLEACKEHEELARKCKARNHPNSKELYGIYRKVEDTGFTHLVRGMYCQNCGLYDIPLTEREYKNYQREERRLWITPMTI